MRLSVSALFLGKSAPTLPKRVCPRRFALLGMTALLLLAAALSGRYLVAVAGGSAESIQARYDQQTVAAHDALAALGQENDLQQQLGADVRSLEWQAGLESLALAQLTAENERLKAQEWSLGGGR